MAETTERTFLSRLRSAVIITVSVFTLLGLFFGGFQFMENTYAKEKEVIFLNHKVDVKILDDRVDKLQDRQWYLEDQLGKVDAGTPRWQDIKRQIREVDAEKSRINDELQIVIKAYKAAEEEIHK